MSLLIILAVSTDDKDNVSQEKAFMMKINIYFLDHMSDYSFLVKCNIKILEKCINFQTWPFI